MLRILGSAAIAEVSAEPLAGLASAGGVLIASSLLWSR